MPAIIRLLRPKNCLMAILSIVIVALVASRLDPGAIPLAGMLFASLVVLMFTGAGNALNDYLDRDIDRLNHPRRPIPSGSVSPRTAAMLSAALFGASIAFGLWLSLYCMLIILFNLLVMLAYEFRAKSSGLSGNIMISWLTASLFLFGGLAVLDAFPSVMEPVLFMFLLSFFATLGREIAKDIQDMDGDSGRCTLPMRVGPRRASNVAAIAFLAGIGLSPLPYFLGIFGPFYLLAVLITDVVFIYAARTVSHDPGAASHASKSAMLLALLAFLMGVI